METYDYLIVGAGLTGAVFAERLADRGKSVLVIDKREHIGGNCYDYSLHSITVHKYGPHIFHTNNIEVWNYLSKFTQWHPYMHRVLACVDGIFVPVPFNFNSIYAVFPPKLAEKFEDKLTRLFNYNQKVTISELLNHKDSELKFLAAYIYENIFKHYTIKQWGLAPEEMDSLVTARVPVNISRDDRYFTDRYQAIPANGYTTMIQNILTQENITVRTGVDYLAIKDKVKYKFLIYTGPIDEFFQYKYGSLGYRSLRFDVKKFDREQYQPVAQVNYPNNYDFTRITEYKHFLDEKVNHTIIAEEYPQAYINGQNEPFYPIASPENASIYAKYKHDADTYNNILFAGRLGWYQYYNMDKAVERALDEVSKLY